MPRRSSHIAGVMPAEDLFPGAAPFQPYGIGNSVLPEVPAQAMRDGHFHRVPVISGGTRDEHRLFVGLFRVLAGQPVTAELYPSLLADAFGELADQVLAQYPLTGFRSPNLAWATVLTDRMWARSTFEQHRLLAERVPTFAYEFADQDAPMYLPFPEDFPPGAFHAADVPCLFPDRQFLAASTPNQRRLSDQDDPLLDELRAQRRSQRRPAATMASLRPDAAGAARAVPRAGYRRHQARGLRRRARSRVLVRELP